MELIRITAQNRESLTEFYAREADGYRQNGSVYAGMLDAMVELVDYLKTSVDAPPVYAVTSHFKLRLLPGDEYTLPTLATVESVLLYCTCNTHKETSS